MKLHKPVCYHSRQHFNIFAMKFFTILVVLSAFAGAFASEEALDRRAEQVWCYKSNTYFTGRLGKGFVYSSSAKDACVKLGSGCSGVVSAGGFTTGKWYYKFFLQTGTPIKFPGDRSKSWHAFIKGECTVDPVDPEALAGWCLAVNKTLTGESETRLTPPQLTDALKTCAKIGRRGCGGLNYIYVPGYKYGKSRYFFGRTLVNSTTSTTWLPRWGSEQCEDLCDTCIKEEEEEVNDYRLVRTGWCKYPGKYLSGYTRYSSAVFTSLSVAKAECLRQWGTCNGITQEVERTHIFTGRAQERFTLRKGKELETSGKGEITWKICDESEEEAKRRKEEEKEVDDGWCKYPGKYSSEGDRTSVYAYTSLSVAKDVCLAQRNTCNGITKQLGHRARPAYTLRKGKELRTSPSGEVTWQWCRPIEEECSSTDLETDYRGIKSETVNGVTCKRWDNYIHPEIYPDAGLQENYCRNPGGSMSGGAWCFKVHVEAGSKPWGYCDVLRCTAE